ncbi:MAG TPA: hypothetical protein PLK79_04830 [Thermoleophilia bacterium]|nr:hypothetical protein [Thermoleophilia bacterium]
MRGKLFLIILAVAVLTTLGGVLVAVAGADEGSPLPGVTAPELIARMGDASRAPQAVSGDIEWTNELFGALPAAPDEAGLAAGSPLLTSGSGRFWVQDGKLRFEAQGAGGDRVVVADGAAGTVWTYTFADDTAHLYKLDGATLADAGDGRHADEPDAGATPAAITPERVSTLLERASRHMTVAVTGTTVVAGRDAYVLTMTPTATDTALGKVEAAIDGVTYVPLRVAVAAAGHDTATLSFRFTRVSYDAVDDHVFAFTPPKGAKVKRDVIEAPGEGREVGGRGEARGHGQVDARSGEARAQGADGLAGEAIDGKELTAAQRQKARAQMKKQARTALLSRDEAAKLVDFPLAWARDHATRDHRGVVVVDDGTLVNALGAPVFERGGDAAAGSPPQTAPVAVQLYGEGFGAIVLAQTRTTADIREQLKQLPAIVDTVDLGGVKAKAIVTPLGSVAVWQRDGVTLVAGGMVPKADLVAFVTSVR